MHVEAIVPDVAPMRSDASAADANVFGGVLDAAGAKLDAADRAESAFASGAGGLQEMVVARAQADVALQIAAAAAQHAVQSINTLLGMQV